MKEGSTSFENWEKPGDELYLTYYVFNITSTGGAGEVPTVAQLGPYTYKYFMMITDITWGGGLATLTPN